MNLEKISEKVNPILDRKELVFNALFDSCTLSKVNAKKELAKLLGADENLIVIKKIVQRFGEGKGKIHAMLYLNKETLDKIEIVHKKAKKKVEEKPAA
ncbi:hypothetical protein HY498_03910 [Candidatus Woesearchaeota archaeon]|nr:hypothetical protein [Candidatus Woesearchaeota archaeon]